MKILASPLIVVLAASAAWPAPSRARARPAAAHFTARSFAAHPLRGTSFIGRSTFAGTRLGRGFSRGLSATPVPPSSTSSGGGGAQSTGGGAQAGAFVGTANNTLIQSPGDARAMTTDGGGIIAYTPAARDYITNAPGAFVGQADKAPTANPGWGSGGASGLNGIFPN